MATTTLGKLRSKLAITVNYVSLAACQPMHFRCFGCEPNFEQNIGEIEKCYKTLRLPMNAEQDEVRGAFLKLAKVYHPDSGSPDANIERFIEIEQAFRTLSRYNTGSCKKQDVDKIIYDIRHIVPQHRQYLSYEGVGIGTPYQRQKQWTQTRAQRAAENVLEHRLNKQFADDNTLMEKGQSYKKNHKIKTKYGFDRLVEDLIQESMSKGEFENLSGKGKPLKNQNRNPYVDFTTHKINEVLINNGFTPEWITMSKEIDNEIEDLKLEIKRDRRKLGPYPLSMMEENKWKKIVESNKQLANSINAKINKYNLIVPLLKKQKFHVPFNDICEDILKNGENCEDFEKEVTRKMAEEYKYLEMNKHDDFIGLLFKVFTELFSFGRNKKINN